MSIQRDIILRFHSPFSNSDFNELNYIKYNIYPFIESSFQEKNLISLIKIYLYYLQNNIWKYQESRYIKGIRWNWINHKTDESLSSC